MASNPHGIIMCNCVNPRIKAPLVRSFSIVGVKPLIFKKFIKPTVNSFFFYIFNPSKVISLSLSLSSVVILDSGTDWCHWRPGHHCDRLHSQSSTSPLSTSCLEPFSVSIHLPGFRCMQKCIHRIMLLGRKGARIKAHV